MCGITGILSFNADEINSISIHAMNQKLIHRGPDGEGVWVNSEGNVGFGHRRLSVLDLSEKGKQPMHSVNGRYIITFNGEIYNYVELKEELAGQGEVFYTDTDTEVLLALFAKHGENCLQLLDGMFAFSIWDDVKKELFCARDRFGEKPFYYYKDSKRMVFASEMKAIFTSGVDRSVNQKRMGGYLLTNSIVSHEDLSTTFYNNIYLLEASHYLKISKDGKVRKTKYWKIDHAKIDNDITLEESEVKFRELFTQSIQRRLRSDVSVGSSLSGGLDSSAIVRIIDTLKDNNQKQRTFSARFKDFDKDEGEFIEAVVKMSDVDDYHTWPNGQTFIDELENVCYHQEEPFQSASISAQWDVMKLAREKETIVLLDGQGADEYLAGYHSMILPFLKEICLSSNSEFKKQHQAYQKLHNNRLPLPRTFGIRTKYPFIGKMIDTANRVRVKKATESTFGINTDLLNESSNKDEGYYKFDNLNEALNYSMFEESLPKLLRYADRNAMAHSVEVRLPFLSHELVEFTSSLPAKYKIHNGWTKYILRRSMEDVLPKKITWRKDKIGYVPPQEQWMENPQVKELIHDSYDFLKNQRIVVNKVDGMEWKYIMTYLMLKD